MSVHTGDYLVLDRFQVVCEIHESSGYDWSVIGVFRDLSDGTFRFATDGGCSCYYAWESFTEPDHYGPRLSGREAAEKVMAEQTTYGEDPVAFRSDCLELVRLIHESVKS